MGASMILSEARGEVRRIEDFFSAKLSNKRDLRIYLPPGYSDYTNRRYPVLYMHDGQGLFDPGSFSQASWLVHETADRLIAEGRLEEIIIVGIDNKGDERLHEFTFPLDATGGIPGAPDAECRGTLYERFIIDELKPFIDRSFRTLPDRSHTGMMGSSLGGLVTYHIGFRNPAVFSKLGIVSPHFVRLDLNSLEEFPFYRSYGFNDLKLWIDIGEIEAHILTRHVREVVDELIGEGFIPGFGLAYCEVPDAAHTEHDWAERLQSPLLFMFGKVGRPVSLRLHGRGQIGLKGATYRLNPLISYDSGFAQTVLQGTYEVEFPEILEVQPDGTLVPKKPGTTQVRFVKGGCRIPKRSRWWKSCPNM
ncbi:alpha/beta hydrolase [Cohnella faecalis]|uniref:Alpha/beta hydrolase n=2 Tax=Cohnella faecalis TaxID=2315694 RepID=A0A398CNR7_9BACL|nr:alpha/beta hydrolase [Cohnella faecalis]